MTILSVIRDATPPTFKRALRSIYEGYTLSQQPSLSFDGRNLRAISRIDLTAVMMNSMIEESFILDNLAISELFRFSEIVGGVNPGDRRAIYYLVASLKPSAVLEIGTHVGASTTYIAGALNRFSPAEAKLTSVDIKDVNGKTGAWRTLGLPHPPREIINQLGWSLRTKFVTMPAADALRRAHCFDFIFLDGDHSAAVVYREVAAALSILNPGGLILLHDFYPGGRPLTPGGDAISGPFAAAVRIIQECPQLRFVPLGNLPWSTKLNSNATSLALIARAE